MRIRAALVSTETGRPVIAVDVDLARALGGLFRRRRRATKRTNARTR